MQGPAITLACLRLTCGASAVRRACPGQVYQARQPCPASRASRPRRRHRLIPRAKRPGPRRLPAERSQPGSTHNIPFCASPAHRTKRTAPVQNWTVLAASATRVVPCARKCVREARWPASRPPAQCGGSPIASTTVTRSYSGPDKSCSATRTTWSSTRRW